ncbi:glycosyltransferase [Clostridium felsineum]|uniref:glycosyltransferase n=1 Tax=Clostridium felsineum TaxID=36839 RepID=UPI00098BE7D9|nr:glycosyltransferase [Clostridium felsineum]URZ16830.1 hypothetical protein CLFE_028770 [Clostridium felsineum DSM 794]
MRSVLLISPDNIAKKMSGPGIRYLNFARELSKKLSVVLFIPNKETDMSFENEKFEVIIGDKGVLKNKVKEVDSVVVQGIAFRLYPFLKHIKKPIAVDIYDPITLENLELRKFLSLKERVDYHETDVNILLEQLAIGDFFICASEKQKDYWMGMLSALNRINPVTYTDDVQMKKLIDVVPFGFNDEEPKKNKNVLKGVWPNINEDDKVLIWGGGIWNWFDPITLIESMKDICLKRNDIKLFFMGIGHPSLNVDTTVADECISRSKKYGIYNKNVFFNEWVDYNERQNYLLEADIGVSTYLNNLETRYSFRTRILDYLWCDLPMVLTNGDYMSELVEKNDLGLCHTAGNHEELANKILELIDNKEKYQEAKQNIRQVKESYKWNNVVKPLLQFCENPYISSDKVKKVKFFYKSQGLMKYYYVRIISKLKRMIKKVIFK